jgi:hypothetical protein
MLRLLSLPKQAMQRLGVLVLVLSMCSISQTGHAQAQPSLPSGPVVSWVGTVPSDYPTQLAIASGYYAYLTSQNVTVTQVLLVDQVSGNTIASFTPDQLSGS